MAHLITSGTLPPSTDFMFNGYQETPGVETITFNGVSFGSNYPNRLIAVGIRYSCSINSNHNIQATIGGVSATRVVNRATTNTGAAFFTAQPSGTSGTVSITLSDADSLYGCVGVWAVNFILDTTPTDTGSDIANNPLDLSLNVLALGVGCAISGVNSLAGGTTTWTGATQDFNFTPSSGSGNYAGASFVASSSGFRTVKAAPQFSGSIAGASVSFR